MADLKPSPAAAATGTTQADALLSSVSTWASNFSRNTSSAFAKLTPKDYIRLVAIVGAYMLLRPYLMKLGAKLQARQHEKEGAEDLSDEQNAAQELRGGGKRGNTDIAIPGVDEESDSESEVVGNTGPSWGTKARRRQRKFIRDALEEQERRLADAESDKEIEEFLVG